ncbi:zinc finger protein 845-like [Homalodisca vitripennis]|uniref:zinc finger protein 845-like n=1 Tax=Homalodisca vitripennis TaxID=197043 RepID=UPI001EECC6C1|nr:zinc finger protein 845-like [Homalodisca vitripennis]
MYQCPDCPRSYCNKKGLSQHRRFECGREREQCCHFCDYRAFRPPQLYRHLRLRHNVEPLLDKDTAFRPPQLYRHLRLRHNVEPLLDKDTGVPKGEMETIYHHIFQNLGHLSPLSKCFGYAPGTLPPPPCLWPFDRLVCVAELHRCPQCGRTYRTLQGWQQHIRLECGKVPGKCCQLCDYKTYYTSHLKRHIVNRHRDLASVVVDDLSNV